MPYENNGDVLPLCHCGKCSLNGQIRIGAAEKNPIFFLILSVLSEKNRLYIRVLSFFSPMFIISQYINM